MANPPFLRSRMLFAAIAAAIKELQHRPLLLQMRLAGMPAYRSRGKGRAGFQHSRHTVAQDKRAALKARNKARMK